MAANMLKIAEAKFAGDPRVSFWAEDIRNFDFSKKYDAVVSSFVLHHIEKNEKPRFFRKIRKALRSGGIFCNIDIFLSASGHLQKISMDEWKAFMKGNGFSTKSIHGIMTRYRREDRPVIFLDELEIMRRAGFRKTDVVFKNYNFSVCSGEKK
jgi:tRNA (cmo5U34)-methyltransferase